MVACLILFGYLLTLWLLGRVFGIAPWVSLLGAAIYAFGGMWIRHYAHVQLFAGLFLPLLFGAAVLYLERLAHRGFGLRQGLLLAIGVAGLLFTSFYVGWFFILFLALTALCFVLVDATQRGPIALPALLNRRSGASLSLVGAVLILALLPFLAYLPKFAEIGARPWTLIAKMLPAMVDLVNVGNDNLIWGNMVRRLVPAEREFEWEHSFGRRLHSRASFSSQARYSSCFPRSRGLEISMPIPSQGAACLGTGGVARLVANDNLRGSIALVGGVSICSGCCSDARSVSLPGCLVFERGRCLGVWAGWAVASELEARVQ